MKYDLNAPFAIDQIAKVVIEKEYPNYKDDTAVVEAVTLYTHDELSEEQMGVTDFKELGLSASEPVLTLTQEVEGDMVSVMVSEERENRRLFCVSIMDDEGGIKKVYKADEVWKLMGLE